MRALVHLGVVSLLLVGLEREARAETPYLVKNIAGGASSALGSSVVSVWSATHGSELLFAATNGAGVSLWKSDGTSAGTVKLADVLPGGINGTTFDYARYAAAVPIAGGVTIFNGAPSGGGTSRVWKTDGTAAGTTTVTSTANVFGYGAAWNGKALFEGSGGSLWVTDGTAAGTKIVKSFYGTRGILALSDSKAITASTEGTGYRVFQTDGTTTTAVAGSPFNATFTGGPSAVMGGVALFVADGGLRSTDGSSTTLVNASVFGTGEYVAVGGVRYFLANGNALWKTDGTSAGTMLVKSALSSSQLVELDGTLYFESFDELWKSDGTAAGTVRVAELDEIENLTAFGGKLYFTSRDSTHGTELWESDGTAAGTKMTADIAPDSESSNPAMFRVVGSTLFFAASDPTNGRELWALKAPSSGSDAGVDSGGTDAAPDTSVFDGASDALEDVLDGASDAEVDGTVDSSIDGAPSDAAPDAPEDAAKDALDSTAEDSTTPVEDSKVAIDATSADTSTTSEPPGETPNATTDDSGGCGCATPGSRAATPSLLLVLTALVVLSRRRRAAAE